MEQIEKLKKALEQIEKLEKQLQLKLENLRAKKRAILDKIEKINSTGERKADSQKVDNIGFVPKLGDNVDKSKFVIQEDVNPLEVKERAKKNLIERKRAEFEELKKEAELHIQFALKVIYSILIIFGILILVYFVANPVVKIFVLVVEVILFIIGSVFFKMLYENEYKIAVHAQFEVEGEVVIFAYKWTNNFIRKIILKLIARMNPGLKKFLSWV